MILHLYLAFLIKCAQFINKDFLLPALQILLGSELKWFFYFITGNNGFAGQNLLFVTFLQFCCLSGLAQVFLIETLLSKQLC